jgi:recombination protein RecA
MGEYLTPLSLAVWFMDDGCTYWPFRHGVKEYKNSKPYSAICTDCFSIDEINILIESIKNNFGLVATIHYHKKNKISEPKPRILFNCEESQKFFSIVKSYMHAELMYKIDEEAYLKYYNNK